ncbi:MAG TPA: hydantoinase/oxoprolinase family protein [Candidatus Rubrimentiphilum sp.]|nr:hydantoinase/oxoprolinase family protein [Candidatus Rubrimentiphilum sp.]
MQQSLLRAGVDVGGTFTDLVAVDTSSGEYVSLKVASTPQAPEQGVIAAIEELLSRYPRAAFEYIAHSTTIATNALLGQIHLELPRVAFITTQGFRDVIEIGRQNRSEVYNLFVTRPRPLVACEDRFTVRERIDFTGRVLTPLEDAEIKRVVGLLRREAIASVAIGFLHSYANPEHEKRMGAAIRSAFPDLPVTLSSDVDPEYREYERFSTAVVNAALMPIVQGYIDRLGTALRERGITAPLYVMQSNGGMATADRISRLPAAIIESGPASGVVAAAELARGARIDRVLSFDMGGTSAKAGTILDGRMQVATEFEAAGRTHSGRSIKGSGYPVRFPFVDLAEISAGGGTIAWVDEAAALQVGPLSAGADPGPACYGRADNATVTDANVVLGRLNPTALLGGSFPIDATRSRDAIATLAQRINLSIEATAAGIIAIVDAQMAKVLRIVTVERGVDPRDFAIVAFGGNGPLHACALATELGVTRIIVPLQPGVFSAHGLLAAPLQASFLLPVLLETTALGNGSTEHIFQTLETTARDSLAAQGVAPAAMQMQRYFDARYRGQSFELEIAAGNGDVAQQFHALHQRRYGYAVENEPVEVVNARLDAIGVLPAIAAHTTPRRQNHNRPHERMVWLDAAFKATPVYPREALRENATVSGPAIIEQYDSCTFVAPEWHATERNRTLVVEKT